MALIDIAKVRLYSHSSCTEGVISFLQEKESFELIEQKDNQIAAPSEYVKADISFAISFLSSYKEKAKGIRNAFLGDKIELSEGEQKKLVAGCDWKGVTKNLQSLESERNDLLRSLSDISVQMDILDGWGDIEVLSGKRFNASFFRVHEKDSDEFFKEVEAVSEFVDIEVVTIQSKEVYYSVIASKDDVEAIAVIARLVKAEEVLLPAGKVQDQLMDLKKEKKARGSKLEENKESILAFLPELDGLKAVYDCYSAREEMEKAQGASVSSVKNVDVIEGWMPQNSIDTLQSELSGKWSGVYIEEQELGENEVPPVYLESSNATRPFSIVTKIYGAPAHNEVDPTPFLMPFFIVFFGLCLTDAGYGMLLAGVMGWILFARMPIAEGMKDMIRLLFYAGISTVIFGVLFGGWFGIDPAASFVPQALTYTDGAGNVKFLGQVFMPMADLMTKIAPLVILLGVFHLLLGVILKGYISLKNKKVWDVTMVSIPTFLTILLGVATLLASVDESSDYRMFNLLPTSLTDPLQMATIVGFVIMSIGILRSGGFIAWFMDVTGWLSNTLSYARLFALGLATGIVASVFNMVAFTIGDMMPAGLDIIVIVFIILFGHTLNVALNLLGAFVHSGRLQFVEFFGQFLNGGGRFFSPITKKSRYVINQ